MLGEVLRKLQAEITATKGDDKEPVTDIGAFLMERVRAHPEDVQKVMAEGKTIVGCWTFMQNEAVEQKKRSFSPTEAFRIVLQYYGVAIPDETPEPVAPPVPKISASIEDLF